MASIIITSGPKEGNYYPLGQRTNVIGRDEAVPIQIVDPNVSRKHMQIRYENDQYLAIDMNSKHGVYIKGVKIDDETVLNDNDYITIGQTDLLFTLDDVHDRENALSHFKKAGQRRYSTMTHVQK
jgi:pSer/pThr/pTyr-binding forkhead associated (FHA) protein